MRLTRPLSALALLAALSAPAAARAQAPVAFQVQSFDPAPAGDPFFAAQDAAVPDRGPAGALILSWAAGPLVLRQGGAEVPGGRLVHRQVWGWAAASTPIAGRLLADVAVPVALHQTGSQPYPDLAKVAASGLGDVRLGLRLPVLERAGATVAVAVRAWLPTGARGAFASDGAFMAEPSVVASGDGGPLHWSGSVGYLIRPSVDAGFARVGSAVTWGAGGAWRVGALRVGPELRGRVGLDGAASPAEALLGGRWASGPWDLGLALGTGLDKAPGAAPVRVLAQVTWLPQAEARAQAGAAAQALAQAEAARKDAQAAEAKAAADRAAAEQAAEQAAQAKALAAQVAAEQAAAERAAAAQAAAQAAAEKAAAERAAAEQAGAGLVKVTTEQIEILQSIQFEVDRDAIRAESEPVLQAVAAVLKSRPELSLVRVEGHTDDRGPADHNTALSELRAKAVQRWLVEHGVAAGRLEARGYGSAQPVADNATAEGRARNRRVDFKILK